MYWDIEFFTLHPLFPPPPLSPLLLKLFSQLPRVPPPGGWGRYKKKKESHKKKKKKNTKLYILGK